MEASDEIRIAEIGSSGGLIRDTTSLGTAYFSDGSANRVFSSDNSR
jgi:hypothetical protein